MHFQLSILYEMHCLQKVNSFQEHNSLHYLHDEIQQCFPKFSLKLPENTQSQWLQHCSKFRWNEGDFYVGNFADSAMFTDVIELKPASFCWPQSAMCSFQHINQPLNDLNSGISHCFQTWETCIFDTERSGGHKAFSHLLTAFQNGLNDNLTFLFNPNITTFR